MNRKTGSRRLITIKIVILLDFVSSLEFNIKLHDFIYVIPMCPNMMTYEKNRPEPYTKRNEKFAKHTKSKINIEKCH